MVELQYFETGCKENWILRKMTVKFIILIFGIFGKKFILKHYMHRNIPKGRVLGVLQPSPHESEVYFTWRRLFLTLLISFPAYASVNFLHFTPHTLKWKIYYFPFTHFYILGICSWMVNRSSVLSFCWSKERCSLLSQSEKFFPLFLRQPRQNPKWSSWPVIRAFTHSSFVGDKKNILIF